MSIDSYSINTTSIDEGQDPVVLRTYITEALARVRNAVVPGRGVASSVANKSSMNMSMTQNNEEYEAPATTFDIEVLIEGKSYKVNCPNVIQESEYKAYVVLVNEIKAYKNIGSNLTESVWEKNHKGFTILGTGVKKRSGLAKSIIKNF